MLPRVIDLVEVAAAYAELTDTPVGRLSQRMFRDTKKLRALQAGGEITVGRYAEAMIWLSVHWPQGAEWPPHVPRPTYATRWPRRSRAANRANEGI